MSTTTLNYQVGGTTFLNKNTQIPTIVTENIVVVQVSPGRPVTVVFSDTQAWIFRSTTADATTDKPMAASTDYSYRFTQTTTFYILRSSVDGVLVATPKLVEKVSE